MKDLRYMERLTADERIGHRIRMRRERMGWSQTRLAQTLGVALRQLQDFESGKVQVGAQALVELARVLECRTRDFFDQG